MLGISIIAIFVASTGLIPHEITNLGIKFEDPDRAALLKLLVAVVGYYTIAFVVYAFDDFMSWIYAMHQARQELRKQRDEKGEIGSIRLDAGKEWSLTSLVTPTSVVRAAFDFFVPVAVAGVAVWSVLGAAQVVKKTPAVLISPTPPTVIPAGPQGLKEGPKAVPAPARP